MLQGGGSTQRLVAADCINPLLAACLQGPDGKPLSAAAAGHHVKTELVVIIRGSYRGYEGIMEKNMETIIECLGFRVTVPLK